MYSGRVEPAAAAAAATAGQCCCIMQCIHSLQRMQRDACCSSCRRAVMRCMGCIAPAATAPTCYLMSLSSCTDFQVIYTCGQPHRQQQCRAQCHHAAAAAVILHHLPCGHCAAQRWCFIPAGKLLQCQITLMHMQCLVIQLLLYLVLFPELSPQGQQQGWDLLLLLLLAKARWAGPQ